jgi:hypothetical protein
MTWGLEVMQVVQDLRDIKELLTEIRDLLAADPGEPE